jgi:hypothetical protein
MAEATPGDGHAARGCICDTIASGGGGGDAVSWGNSANSQQHQCDNLSSRASSQVATTGNGPFVPLACNVFSPDDVDRYVATEIRRLRRRRVLPRYRPYSFGGGSVAMNCSTAADQLENFHLDDDGPDSPNSSNNSGSDSDNENRTEGVFGEGATSSAPTAQSKKDVPMFTRRQVRLICERLLKEQEGRLREEYQRALSEQLSEQHDTFVRFAQDSIHRKYPAADYSYLS